MKQVQLKQVKENEFFTLKPIEYPNDMQVYVRNHYDRSTKTYSASKYGDMMFERFFKPTKLVWIDFEF
jgi:hypothetical protein